MAGRPKQGIDYSGWSVDIFDGDKKIDKLLDAKGWKGFGIYFFLCQRAYKVNGYFYEWGYDDCATTARRMGGGISSGTVKETVDYCLQVDLFDKGLFDRWGILTSRGIQRRFWAVLSERRSKTVYGEYWLLKPEECKGLVKVSLFSDMQPTNDDVQGTNDDSLYRKESKVKKSRAKENKELPPSAPPEGKEEERKEDSVSLPIPGYAFNTMTHNYPGLTDTLQRLGINEVGEVNAILRLSDYGRKGTTVWRLIANTCWSDIGAKGRYLIAALNRAKRK